MPPDDGPEPSNRSWRSVVPAWLRHGLIVFLVLLVVEYLVIPQLVGASKNLHLLSELNVGWLVAGILFEAGSLLSYALLTRTLLPEGKPGLSKLVRIVLSTTAVAHVIPGGAASGTGLGYRLLTSSGVEGADAGFALATQSIGSAVVLNVMLWFALVVSIPLAGLHPIYVVTALVGLLAMIGATLLAFALTRGGERAVRVVRSIGRRIPRVGADRLERVVRQVGDSVSHLVRDRALLKRGLGWAALNWLFDAASLWSFVAAFGHFLDPIELFAAYGIANVLGSIPITPGGLGVIEASAATLLVSFGVTRIVATYAVLGWRLVNFWLPIPVGAGAYISIRAPRGSSLRDRRQALAEMAAEAKRLSDGPGADQPREEAGP